MSEIAVQEKAPLEELQAQMRGKDTRAQIVKVLPENVSIDKFERDWKYDAGSSILSKRKLIRWCKVGENL